jgi:hypothetical protein
LHGNPFITLEPTEAECRIGINRNWQRHAGMEELLVKGYKISITQAE